MVTHGKCLFWVRRYTVTPDLNSKAGRKEGERDYIRNRPGLRPPGVRGEHHRPGPWARTPWAPPRRQNTYDRYHPSAEDRDYLHPRGGRLRGGVGQVWKANQSKKKKPVDGSP